MRAWADAEDEPDEKYRDAHVWYADDKDDFTANKLLVAESSMATCTRFHGGVTAAGNVMAGGRDGVDLPSRDVDRVKSHLAKYYDTKSDEAPWVRD